MSEADIQREILNAISRGRIRAWRQNAGKVYVVPFKEAQRKGVRGHFMDLAPAGAADICGLIDDGRILQLEVKSATGKQNPDQIAWQNMIRTRNGIYLCARSAGEALDQISQFLV